jgi:hypothetical protein
VPLRLPLVWALAPLLLAALLWAAQARGLSQRPATQLGAEGRVAGLLLGGFHAPERDARGAYRWTAGAGMIDFDPPAGGGVPALDLRLGPAPPAGVQGNFSVDFGGQTGVALPIDARPRQYHMLVPREALRLDGLIVELRSPTVTTQSDPRPLGLRFEGAALRVVGARTVVPAPGLVLAQTALLLLGALLLWRLRLPLAPSAAALALPALAIAVLGAQQELIIYRYVARLALALALLAGLTFWLLPQAERRLGAIGPPKLIRALWGLMLLACMIRLAGALYPLFSGFDLGLNADRLLQNLTGRLVITRRSIEFHNGITIYPPGPYLVFLPGLLLGLTPALLVQSAIALTDGLAALGVGALARAFGASARAAIVAMLLYAAVPVGLTALWWGLTAQVFGQALMAPLALALLAAFRRPGRVGAWALAGALLSVAVLTHIGVTIVAFAWLGLAWLALARRGAPPPPAWRRLTLILAISGALGLLLLYVDVAALKVQQADSIGRELMSEGYAPIYALIWRGFLIAFHPLVLLLLPAGLLLLLRRRLPIGAAALVGGWLGAAALFLLIEIVTGLQVRYIYFLTPLACILGGVLLDRLAARGVAASRVAWCVAVLLLAQGCVYWLVSAFADLRMSMVSLLR